MPLIQTTRGITPTPLPHHPLTRFGSAQNTGLAGVVKWEWGGGRLTEGRQVGVWGGAFDRPRLTVSATVADHSARTHRLLLVYEVPYSAAVGDMSVLHPSKIASAENPAKLAFNWDVKDNTDPRECSLGLSWEEVAMMARIGKSFTGGMGQKAMHSAGMDPGVWVCVRDWDRMEQSRCGAAPGRYACFAFNEMQQHFDFLGLNEKTQLVTLEQEREGKVLEMAVASTVKLGELKAHIAVMEGTAVNGGGAATATVM
ncbi:hypothetical protein T484DRAFT_2138492 [Baffinella frigidus]|nr:hypothetical protein T484DRAFT_2138492 [Cryptophyta sp. CCMP2293]